MRRSWRNGRPGGPAFLDDYASLANALTTLHQQQPQRRWLDEAVSLADTILARFADRRGGFFYTPDDHEPLIVRKKDLVDNSTPSGNGLAVVASPAAGRSMRPRRLSPGCPCGPPRLPRRLAAVPRGRRTVALGLGHEPRKEMTDYAITRPDCGG